MAVDKAAKTVTLTPFDDPQQASVLSYVEQDRELVLKGKLGDDDVSLVLRRRDPEASPLIDYDFRWAIDDPISGEGK